MSDGRNSAAPTTAQVTGGVYNATPPTLQDGQGAAIQLDVNGNIKIAGVGGTTNVNVTGVNGSAPALSNPLPVELSDGAQQIGSVANPLNDNVAKWGGSSVAASATTAPAGTEAAPVTRDIIRKSGSVLSTTNLGNGGVFTGPWIDTNQTGDHFVEATVFSNQASTTNGFVIQESDDSSDTNFTSTVVRVSVTASLLTTIQAVIRARFWRVVYTNAATPTTVFKITATGSSTIPYVVLAGIDTQGTTIPAQVSATVSNPPTSVTGGAATPLASLLVAAGTIGVGSDGSLATIQASGSNGAGNFAVTPYLVTAPGNPATLSQQRTPNIFKTVQATASGNTALWTPTAGKKFRLMRFMVQITGNAIAAVAGVLTVSFQDSTTAIGIAMDGFIPTSAATPATEDFISPWVDLGNGFLSAAANNVLNVNLSFALTGGNVRITVAGTEE